MEVENAHLVEEEQAELHGNSMEGQIVWSGLRGPWLQSQSKAALLQTLQGSPGAVKQLHDQVQLQQKKPKRDGLSQTQSFECVLEKQLLALEMLLQECQALKAQLRQHKAATQEQERERSLHVEWDQHIREQLSQAESCIHVLESSLDLYKKKYRAALGRVGELESQMQHLEEEARGKAIGRVEEQLLLEDLWSKGQVEDNLGQLKGEQHSAQEMGQGLELTCQQDKTIQELQVQLAVSHTKLLQQREALANLHQEFASYKLTHSRSDTSYRSQLVSQETLRQKLQQMEEEGLQKQVEEYWALVQELKLELAREVEQNSNTLKDLARLELAVQSLCQEAAAEQNQQQRELAALQYQLHRMQVLLGQSHRLCVQKERAIRKQDRLLQRARASQSISQQRAQARPLNAASQEAKHSQAQHASQRAGALVLQQRRAKTPERQRQAVQVLGQEEAATEVGQAQAQLVECGRALQHPGQVGCPLDLLHGRRYRAEAEVEQKRELPKELREELSRYKQPPLQAASVLELELLQQQLQEEWRVQGLWEQKAGKCSLQEQLTQQKAVLRLVRRSFRQAQLQLQEQVAKIKSLQISLEASRAGNHWLYQESELVVANVHQWVKEQKQANEKLDHKLRTQVKQIAQLTGERDLLHEVVERLQQDNQRLKNEANEKHIVCERIKALHNSDLEPHTVLQQLWHILLL